METIYLNHAGTSWPKPDPVWQAVKCCWELDPANWSKAFEESRNEIASFFGVADSSRLLLTPSCTSALAIAIADQEWNPGDRVLTSGMEHHALHRPLFKLTERDVDLIRIDRIGSEPIALDHLERELKRGPVQMVAVSAASNVTGEIYPLSDIISLAHDHGALVLVDAAQTAGWGVFDLVAMSADMFTFAGHKGLQAPWGVGGLYVSPSVCMNSLAASCEVVNQDKQLYEIGCSQMPGFCDAGSVNMPAAMGLAAATRWLSESSQSERFNRASELAGELEDGLRRIPGIQLRGNSCRRRMPTVSFTVDGFTPTTFAQAVKSKGLIGSGGLQCAPLAHRTLGTAPDGVFRLSCGPFTSHATIQSATAIISIVATAQ